MWAWNFLAGDIFLFIGVAAAVALAAVLARVARDAASAGVGIAFFVIIGLAMGASLLGQIRSR